MRLYTLLFITVFVVGTRAASIPAKLITNTEKRINTVVDDVEKTIEKLSKQPDETVVKLEDVKLKTNEVQAIPVKVIAEKPKPAPETDKEHSVDYVPTDDEVTPDIKRVEIDPEHPGEPQRQEHDSQSPAKKPESAAVEMIKQNVVDAQNTFKQGFQGVTQNIQNWIADNEQLQSIQENIQNLQDSFNSQIQRLNATVQGFFRPQSQDDNDDIFVDRRNTKNNVVKTINGIGETFNSGIEDINFGVEMLAAVKESSPEDIPQLKQSSTVEQSSGTGQGSSTSNQGSSTGGSAGSTTSPASGGDQTSPFGGIGQFFANFQNSISQGFGNVSSLIQNYVNQNGVSGASPGTQGQQTIGQPGQSGAQSDEGRPTIWQGIQTQFTNIFRPQQAGSGSGQNNQPASGPFAQAISNNPIVQNFNQFFRPTEKPTESQPEKPAEGSNVVPETPASQSDVQPAQPIQPVEPVSQPAGPIQAAIQRNPIVQGLAGAVQRLQNTVTNPEKPREVEKDATRKHGGSDNAATGDSSSNGITNVKEKPEIKPEEIQTLCDKKDEKEPKPIDKKD